MIKALVSVLSWVALSSAFADAKGDVLQLGRAIGVGDAQLLSRSLEKIKNIDEPLNAQRETPLTLAAYNDRSDWVVQILKRGAHVNHQTTTGFTALMFAAMTMVDASEAYRTAEVLLRAGADRHLKNLDGKTAYDLAVAKEQPKIADLIQKY